MPNIRQTPQSYMTRAELLKKAEELGCKVTERKLRYWQFCGLVPRPKLISGYGHVGYYTEISLMRLVMVARSRKSHKELKRLDRRPTREVLAVLNGGIPEMLEIIEYQDLPDGRQACILRDGSILVRNLNK